MKYKGIINKSRTYDLTALSQIIDGSMGIFLLYSPEQLGITLPIYMAIRLILNATSIIVRNKTTGPVGQK